MNPAGVIWGEGGEREPLVRRDVNVLVVLLHVHVGWMDDIWLLDFAGGVLGRFITEGNGMDD